MMRNAVDIFHNHMAAKNSKPVGTYSASSAFSPSAAAEGSTSSVRSAAKASTPLPLISCTSVGLGTAGIPGKTNSVQVE